MSDIIQLGRSVRWEDLDKLTTLDTRRHSLYHGVCGLGLSITGGNLLTLKRYSIGSLTLTCGLILILLAFFNFNFAGIRVVLISTFIVVICALADKVISKIDESETERRFHNFEYEEDKYNGTPSESREIWNLIVSGVLLLTEIILSLATYATIIDFGDDVQREELVEQGFTKVTGIIGEKRHLPKATSHNYTIIPQSALGYITDNYDLIEQIELEQAQQMELDDEIIMCMAQEADPDD
ncbi:Oidioi.mRNA.OKI2018_I69.XSR.g16188.t1.cds [Oikopleura dioica]|uniref:Oidioi.mRNA.OKI2018_I69.XSR.g16188.t1.cds n=1 Tax=Oikopleura dioica TaxID=34765 RepID=A0ABN7SK68_OIKDI|nr:Oidioi.mRNA.OKI2018_I69.XSR.g16188.t1.cds [Oikopleura dioica]